MADNPLMSLFRQSEKDRRPYSQTLEKGMLWPVVKSGYTGKPQWSTEGGLIGSAIDAFTLPGRVYNGEVAPDDPGEMVNFVGNVLGGGMAANMRRGVNPGVASMSGAQPPKPQGIRAYHGSPHDFDRFDMSKIGTGEGAQSYGHGLYFAENDAVAKRYREVLTESRGPTVFEPKTEIERSLQKYVDEVASSDGGTMHDLFANLEHAVRKRRLSAEALDSARVMNAEGRLSEPKGRMYEVNIKADPADFLDWDKPLSQQSASVAPLLQRSELVRNLLDDPASEPNTKTAGEFLRALSKSEEKKFISDAGIPGIRYLDQGSRAAGEGTRNYVVFDDKLIEILRKYGLLGGVVGGGAMAGGTDAQAGQ